MREQPFHQEQVGSYIIAIYPDPEPQNPCEEWDMLGTLLCRHRRYNLGHGGSWGKQHKYATPDDFLRSLVDPDVHDRLYEKYEGKEYRDRVWKEIEKDNLLLPVSIYEHGGMTMWVGGPSYPLDPGGWDTSRVGWIWVSKEKAQAESGKQWRKQAEEVLRAEVGSYDDYLTGNCWGYVIYVAPEGVDETWEPDDLRDLDEYDSCWGFLGDYEYCLEEARSLVRHTTKETA